MILSFLVFLYKSFNEEDYARFDTTFPPICVEDTDGTKTITLNGKEVTLDDLWQISVGGVLLGGGSFATVRKGTIENEQTSLDIAVKALKYKTAGRRGGAVLKKEFLREANLLAFLQGKHHVSQLLGCIYDSENLVLVLNVFPYSLSNEEQVSNFRTKLALSEKLKVYSQILSTLSMLHSSNIIHTDISRSNILFENAELKNMAFIDFGLSGYRGEPISQLNDMYAPPEFYISKKKFVRDFPQDIWSITLVIIALEMGHENFYTGYLDAQGEEDPGLIVDFCVQSAKRGFDQILGANKIPELKGVYIKFFDVLLANLAFDPKSRFNAQQLSEAFNQISLSASQVESTVQYRLLI